jgi:hypothetical protein
MPVNSLHGYPDASNIASPAVPENLDGVQFGAKELARNADLILEIGGVG